MLSVCDTSPLGLHVETGDTVEFLSGPITLTPPVGWTVLNGSRDGSHPDQRRAIRVSDWVELVDDEISVIVRTRSFSGTSGDLLDEIVGRDAVGSERKVVIGGRGVLYAHHDENDPYVATALVLSTPDARRESLNIGVEIIAEGSAAALAQRAHLIEALTASVQERTCNRR